MSLEQAIKDLTAAVEANTAAHAGGSAPAKTTGAKKPAAGKKPATKKGPTQDDVTTKFGEYLKVSDKDEREACKANVKLILGEVGAARITEIEEADFVRALELLHLAVTGGLNEELGIEGEDEEEEDDMM